MRKTIEDLYHGNINPNEQVIIDGSKYARELKTILGAENYLESVLNDIGKKALNKFVDAYMELLSITSREFFIQGFRLGLRMGVEAMDEDSRDIKELISTLE